MVGLPLVVLARAALSLQFSVLLPDVALSLQVSTALLLELFRQLPVLLPQAQPLFSELFGLPLGFQALL